MRDDESTVERRFAAMTARAAARKRSRPDRPESDNAEPSELERESSRKRKLYARILYEDPAATLDDLREAVTTIAEAARTARRVLGGAHPSTENFERSLQIAQTYYRRKMQIN